MDKIGASKIGIDAKLGSSPQVTIVSMGLEQLNATLRYSRNEPYT